MSPAIDASNAKKAMKKKNKDKRKPEKHEVEAAGGVDEVVETAAEGQGAEQRDADSHDGGREVEASEVPNSEQPLERKRRKDSGIMTSESFSRLPVPLSEPTLKAIQEMGFENMTQDRQTGTATQTKEVTVEGLQQGYCVVPSDKRFMVLYAFLKRNQSKKIMVFFSSCNSVKYHSELLRYIQIDCLDIHGKQKQEKRTATFFQFCQAEKGILLCTDVAARGLDIPSVDWIVQYDPPDEPKEYIHSVGRTARGEGSKGNALLFLLPEELQFLLYLKEAKVPVKEYACNKKKVPNLQSHLEKIVGENYYLNQSAKDAYRSYILEKIVGENYYLNQSAKDAYRSYILAYNSHSMKNVFNVHHLNLKDVAASFCFTSPPKVRLDIDSSTSKFRKKTR